MAVERTVESGGLAIRPGQRMELTPPGPVPPSAAEARRAAQEAYHRVVASGAELITLPTRPLFASFQPQRPVNTVAAWACGRNFPLYQEPVDDVEGVLVAPDRSRLAVVHIQKRQYSGAAVPLYLQGVRISVVDLRTFAVTSLPVEPGDFGIQSIALAWASPTRLRLRLKDVWNTASDKRLYATCDVEKLSCTLPTAPTPVEADFPQGDVLEVTSLSAYPLEPVPAGFQAPENLVARTVHVSPDQRWVSFVTDDEDANEMFPSTRHLWVRPLSGGEAVEVAHGEGLFHARWLDAEQLVFEPPPEPGPRLANLVELARKDPDLERRAESIAGDSREPRLKERLVEWLALQGAARELGEEKDPASLWRVPLRRYSVRTRETVEHHPGPARLWGSLGGPTHHRKGPAREVPTDSEQRER